MKSIYSIIALTTIIAAIGLYNMPREEPNDTINFSYCNAGGKPTVFDITSIHSLAPIKHKQKNTFVFVGTVKESVYIHKAHITAKIGSIKKSFDQAIDKQTTVGPFNNQLPVDLSKDPIKGKCKLTIQYMDKSGNVVDCENLTFNIR